MCVVFCFRMFGILVFCCKQGLFVTCLVPGPWMNWQRRQVGIWKFFQHPWRRLWKFVNLDIWSQTDPSNADYQHEKMSRPKCLQGLDESGNRWPLHVSFCIWRAPRILPKKNPAKKTVCTVRFFWYNVSTNKNIAFRARGTARAYSMFATFYCNLQHSARCSTPGDWFAVVIYSTRRVAAHHNIDFLL